MTSGDTIVAISSAVGPAARMVVRTSGPQSVQLATTFWLDPLPAAGAATFGTLRFSDLSVPGWLYIFHAPHSYTGENLVEFHIPGNALLARMLLDALTSAGARPADPGEFTARAYFNGRIDLTEAEGVAATIAAGNEQELRAARQLLAGELARRLRPASDLIAETLALVEVGIDFVDEDVTFLSAADVNDRVSRADALLRDLLETSSRFERLSHEPRVVLVGRPNAGKSTLLNALAGHERAVTSPVAGTTRDVLTAEVALPRGIVKLTDAAGIEGAGSPHTVEANTAPSSLSLSPRERVGVREASQLNSATSPSTPPHPNLLPKGEGTRRAIDALPVGEGTGEVHDAITRQMRSQALRAVEAADVLVLVRDIADTQPDLDLPRTPDFVVRTKLDLLPAGASPQPDSIMVSAFSGANLDALRRELDCRAFGNTTAAGSSLALNARHIQAVSEARAALSRAVEHANTKPSSAELIALELREALDAAGRVVGMVSPDELLGRVFSAFCIGK